MMTGADEVVRIVDWLELHEVTYQVNGGWAVDALVGRQTRQHGDLDVFLDADHSDALVAWLVGRGYEPMTDWLPVRLELAGPHGRVDVHPMQVDANGDGVQVGLGATSIRHRAVEQTTGVIGGRSVVVATAARLRALHEGYAPRPVDVHDLRLLAALPVTADPPASGGTGAC